MTLDELLLQIRARQLLLISEQEIWPSPYVTQAILRALRRHKKGLRVLLTWADVRTCASPAWHRPYWRHCGDQNYQCEICARIAC